MVLPECVIVIVTHNSTTQPCDLIDNFSFNL